jgi:hypothetical protein
MESSEYEHDSTDGACKHDNGLFGSAKGEEFLTQ